MDYKTRKGWLLPDKSLARREKILTLFISTLFFKYFAGIQEVHIFALWFFHNSIRFKVNKVSIKGCRETTFNL